MSLGKKRQSISRRVFLERMQWAPFLLLPSPMRGPLIRSGLSALVRGQETESLPPADVRFTPTYPTLSPLDDLLRRIDPGSDEYVVEGIKTNIAFHKKILASKKFRDGDYDTHFLEEFLPKYE